MFQKLKGICLIAVLGLVVVFLGGCSFQKDKSASDKNSNETKKTTTEATPELPAATGKISDITDSLSVAVSGENEIISQNESSAKSAVTDSQETSDFSQVYNENEF